MLLEFAVFEKPRPKARHRSRIVWKVFGRRGAPTGHCPRCGRPYWMMSYTPKGTATFERMVAIAANNAIIEKRLGGDFPFDGPVAMEVIFFFRRPKGVPKSQKFPTGKPDLSNCLKAIEDAMNGVVYRDDSQIVSCKDDKRYAADDTEPRARIVVWTAGHKPWRE